MTLTAVEAGSPPEFRFATLMCSPKIDGTHPDAKSTCDELNAVNGNFDKLTGTPGICPNIWRPVTIVAQGFWQGAQLSFKHSFPNRCIADHASKYVYRF
ncbi:SSI family serine proteinase inhibitor [Nocardia sp. NPDC056000]|uniref:SSI family serine proteinase inhibitor n=1 Tax=Nocardia sp. NPDC056000 TaxID=3345674 RepID=UPI0035DFF2CD